MSKTRAQLVTRALQKLQVTGAGQTASAEDQHLVDGVVDPVMADLAVRDIYAWGNEDDIPDEAFEHLAGLVADAAAPDFSRPGNEQTRVLLESRLRILNTPTLSGQVLRTEYF